MKVLILENDDISLATLVKEIKSQKHEIEISRTGEESIKKFILNRFPLVLLNLDLSDFKWRELILKLKEIQPEVGIVTMTNYNSRELELNVRQQGVSFYMVKPVTQKEIKAILAHFSTKSV